VNQSLLYVLAVVATYRLTRLGTKDDFPPVLWLRDKLAGGWRPFTEKDWAAARAADIPDAEMDVREDGTHLRYVRRVSWSPYWLAELISCPWCLSGWLSGAVVALLDLNQSLPDPVLFGFAVWGGAALLASRKWA
jgi:hypothetical protein